MYLFEEHKTKSWCGYYVTSEVEPYNIKFNSEKFKRDGEITYITLNNSYNPHKIVFALYKNSILHNQLTHAWKSTSLYFFDYTDSDIFDNMHFLIGNKYVVSAPLTSYYKNDVRIETNELRPNILYSINSNFGLDILKNLMSVLQANIDKFLRNEIRFNAGLDNEYSIYNIQKNFKSPDTLILNLLQYAQVNFTNANSIIDSIKKIYPNYLKNQEILNDTDDDSGLF